MMKEIRAGLILLFVLLVQVVAACPLCEKQQPKITQGLTHGTGPQNNWDWVIVAVIATITIVTLVFSLKYLINPKEKNSNHIKRLILESY